MITMDATEQKTLLEALETLKSFVENVKTDKGCISCINWKNDGCAISGGQVPPAHVRESGCPKWEIWDEIPF